MLIEQGQVRRGSDLVAQAAAISKSLALGDFTAAPNARQLIYLGLKDRAAEMLNGIPQGFDSQDYRFDLAEIGDPAQAEALLRRDLEKFPSDTLLNFVSAPEVRAALALRDSRRNEAVTALQPTTPYMSRVFDTHYVRGLAYLAARDGEQAAREFHWIIDHPTVDPVTPLYPLARLGLARAERLKADMPASRHDYEVLLNTWKDANGNLPPLQEAKAEYTALKDAIAAN